MRHLKISLMLIPTWLGFATGLIGQSLVIESPDPGPTTKVIYGRLTKSSVFIFEQEYSLVPNEASELESVVVKDQSSDPTSALEQNKPEISELPQSEAVEKTVLTSFLLPSEDIPRCMNSPRFMGLTGIANALKERINNVVINSGTAEGSCSEEIAAKLAKTLPNANISIAESNDDGIKIYLEVLSNTKVPRSTRSVVVQKSSNVPEIRTLADVVKWSEIFVDDQKILANALGWFVMELPNQREYKVKAVLPGYQPINVQIYPVLLSSKAAPVQNSQAYSTRSAEFNRPTLSIKLIETPYVGKKAVVDGGLGGGYGFGREVPDEKRGQRTVANLGIERREWFGLFGGRFSIFHSRAPTTSVPATYTIRASGFYDGEPLSSDLYFRLGAGVELFKAKLSSSQKKIVTVSEIPTANIPKQVLSPMVTLSMQTIFFDRMIVSANLVATPLYIASIGLYTSLSPGMEFSAKFFRNWMVSLQLGKEMHRYPSQIGETRLQLDYGLITIKKGVQ